MSGKAGSALLVGSVLLVEPLPRRLNNNHGLVGCVQEALAARCGAGRVKVAPLDRAPTLVAQTSPDFVLLFGSVLGDGCDLGPLTAALRRTQVPLVVWTTDDPYEVDAADKLVDVADLIFTNDRASLLAYRLLGRADALHLPLAAAEPRHFRKVHDTDASYLYDVFFCGVGFDNRQAVIDGLRPVLAKVDALVCGTDWEQNAPWIMNRRLSFEEVLDAYQNSRIVLNLGRSHSFANQRFQLVASTPGPRLFEAALAGGFQLAFFDRPEIMDYFALGREIAVFDGLRDARDAIARYLSEPGERLAMARAAQRRVRDQHLYVHRVDELLRRVEALPARGRRLAAPAPLAPQAPSERRSSST